MSLHDVEVVLKQWRVRKRDKSGLHAATARPQVELWAEHLKARKRAVEQPTARKRRRGADDDDDSEAESADDDGPQVEEAERPAGQGGVGAAAAAAAAAAARVGDQPEFANINSLPIDYLRRVLRVNGDGGAPTRFVGIDPNKYTLMQCLEVQSWVTDGV
jgi:hypothetical protein